MVGAILACGSCCSWSTAGEFDACRSLAYACCRRIMMQRHHLAAALKHRPPSPMVIRMRQRPTTTRRSGGSTLTSAATSHDRCSERHLLPQSHRNRFLPNRNVHAFLQTLRA